MAVGNCLQLSTGSGWDVLQWKGWARPEPRRGCAQACPGCSGFVHAWNGPQGAAVEAVWLFLTLRTTYRVRSSESLSRVKPRGQRKNKESERKNKEGWRKNKCLFFR